MNTRVLSLCFAIASWAWPQSASPELPPGVLMLSRVKAHVKEQFAHMPQYTCLETLERFHKSNAPKAVQRQLDTVRLEVLFAGRQEYYDSPGGRNFKEADPARFVSSGMIGGGMFAAHLQNIFVDDNGIFNYRGEEDLNGRHTVRFDFYVPVSGSAYQITVSGAQANVGTRGVFWVDPLTYDLIRIEIHADEIPPILQTADVLTTVDYARTRIGEEEVLLAQTGTLTMVRTYGEESMDRFAFTHCRAYQAESSISFDEPGAATHSAAAVLAATPARGAKPAAQSLPAGVSVAIALTSALTDGAAVGDLIEGKVVGDVIAHGVTIIHDGAVAHGRVRRLEKSADFGGYFSIGLEFTDIDAGETAMRFFADLQTASPVAGLEWGIRKYSSYGASDPMSRTTAQTTTIERVTQPELPGVGSFFVRGKHFELPAGFRMIWKTRAMRSTLN